MQHTLYSIRYYSVIDMCAVHKIIPTYGLPTSTWFNNGMASDIGLLFNCVASEPEATRDSDICESNKKSETNSYA